MTRVSPSFFTDNPRQGDPSLWIMRQLADALDKTLTDLIKETNLDNKSLEALQTASSGNSTKLRVRIF
jgi:hypothetical protein